MSEEEKDDNTFTLPEGRLINHSLFVKDQFNKKAVPSYKIEMAYEAGVLDDFYEDLLDAAVDRWGEGADKDDDLVIPILDGDKLARKREKKDKPGDAYKGMEILRANTQFNKHGEDDDGGICVYDLDTSEIGAGSKGKIYQGCYGHMACTIGTYENNDGDNALTLYLVAFQKSKDGEKLITPKDHSKLFKPVGRKASGGGRRSRKG